ncbi:MAG: peptide chain release factor N(5)-glutamine methyltransferase [Candidatus Moranbacteria bacterium]|nr:peptide chain release factor N(5)-glutamine methyltransferase [Candidatus Moranbacteria bacterium]
MNIQELLKKWHEKVNLPEIELLISHELNKNRSFITAHPEYKLNFWQIKKIENNLKKRQKNIPLAYLTKEKEFYGRAFFVNKNTLIPRPETELIIENVLEQVENNENKNYLILDIGTGSGNIPITLAKELRELKKNDFKFIATDISKKTLKVAKKNATRHKVKNNIQFYKSDLLKNKKLKEKIKNAEKEIILIANLPYVNENFKNDLLKKEKSKALKFEPATTLWSNDEGLNHYDRLIQEIKEICDQNNKKVFTVYFEISPEQTNYLTKKIKNYFPNAEIIFKKDLAGLNRLCVWK